MTTLSQNTLVPNTAARLSEALHVVIEGLQDVLVRFDPEIGRSLAGQIAKAVASGKDTLGLGALATIVVLSGQHIGQLHSSKVTSYRFHQLMKILTTLYIFENVTDDLCVVDISESGTRYRYADVMRAFYIVMEGLIEGHITLYQALAQVSTLPTDHIQVPYIDRLLELYPLPHRINDFFALHLLTVSDVLAQLHAFEVEFGELKSLIQKARTGLLNRYRASRICIDNPDVSVSVALERGKETIFTDFHCPYVMLSAASADPTIRPHLAYNLEAVITSVDHSSYLHRIFNEAGISGIRPDVTLKIFSEASDVYGKGLTPRAYITQLIQTITPDTRRQIARLVKDVEEQEANIVLDSSHQEHAQPAALLRHNLLFLNRQLNVSLTTLKQALSPIEHPYIAGMMSNFLEFQRSIYSLMVGEGGEYVGARETLLLNGLTQILNAEYPMVFIDRLLAQSKASEAGV
jgi:hypothetical protein